MNNEEWYDKEAAPRLRALIEEASARGMSAVAVIEYAPGHRGRTSKMGPHAGLAMKMLTLCAAAGENIDGYVINLARYCREHKIDTSASIIMQHFGSANETGAEPK
jgi:hypothetical protein